jgi:hypothetical protein
MSTEPRGGHPILGPTAFAGLATAAAILVGLTGAAPAAATEVSGSSALALAALVAAHSPQIAPGDGAALSALFADRADPGLAKHRKITVRADAVTCRSSNVDIALHSCDLSFGKTVISPKAGIAHELFATLIEAGVPSDGAAGSNFESLTKLSCTIDPAAVLQKAGGGANCSFTPGTG